MESPVYRKSQTTFYRRLYVAHLIDAGFNTKPLIMEKTGMPKRTVQDVISSLAEMGMKCEFHGARKNGCYVITDWAAINKEWINNNLKTIIDALYL